MVDLVGIEPTTSSMPWKRAPNCATGPQGYPFIFPDLVEIVKQKRSGCVQKVNSGRAVLKKQAVFWKKRALHFGKMELFGIIFVF